MTALGKILVFVNLVFSLVTAGLIIMVFIARTNWSVGYKKVSEQYQVAQADLATEIQSKAIAQQQRATERTVAEKTLKGAQAQTEKVKGDLAAEQTQRSTAEKERDAAKAINETTKEENKRLVAEQQNLQGQMQARDGEIVKLKRDILRFKDDSTKFELAFKAATQRAELLLEQLTTSQRQVRALQATSGTPSGGRTSVAGNPSLPPAEDVRGQVTQVDTARHLATVSVGSDVGVVPGTMLELFRLDADPNKSLYLGTLRIISARSKDAVGQFTLASNRNPLKVGDEVASRLSTSR